MDNLAKNSTKISRTARLGFRVTSHQEALIRKAAEITGKNGLYSDFPTSKQPLK